MFYDLLQMNASSFVLRHDALEPVKLGATWDERWNGPDEGLLVSYARGLEMRQERPDLAMAVDAGELPVLPFRGGVERETKVKKKTGTWQYLAMWQGLRADDLNVDRSMVVTKTCARSGVAVAFGPPIGLLALDQEKRW